MPLAAEASRCAQVDFEDDVQKAQPNAAVPHVSLKLDAISLDSEAPPCERTRLDIRKARLPPLSPYCE